MKNEQLTKKSYWDSRYAGSLSVPSESLSKFRRFLRSLMPNAPWSDTQADRHRLFISDRYLPRNSHFKLLEVGCASGRFLLSYNLRYGYEPWGIDYSSEGVAKARELFTSVGLDSSRIMQEDFFSEAIINNYTEFFDIVISHGFIEHFGDPLPVISHHVMLLRSGGLLLITIPNLLWFNYLRVKVSFPAKLAMHNLKIMNRATFRSLFDQFKLQHLFVGYVGTISLRHLFPSWFPDIDSISDKLLWLFLRHHAIPNRFFSPDLMYIGRKL